MKSPRNNESAVEIAVKHGGMSLVRFRGQVTRPVACLIHSAEGGEGYTSLIKLQVSMLYGAASRFLLNLKLFFYQESYTPRWKLYLLIFHSL